MFDVWTRADLRGKGMTIRQIRHAVGSGALVRARKGFYVAGDAPDAHHRAARIGGRLGCISLLAELGVFVFDSSTLHVHMERGDSRMRRAHGDGVLGPRHDRGDVVLHWRRLAEPVSSGAIDIIDAVAHAVRCQEPRHAIATIDSALNTRFLSEAQLDDVFAQLSRRHQVLRHFVDGRAEAGTESLMRLILMKLGCRVDVQVLIDGVGRVDLLVDGWLVIECDSKQFHSEWAQQRSDYRRDMALATLGCFRIRFLAEDILYRPEVVIAALRGILHSARRPV